MSANKIKALIAAVVLGSSAAFAAVEPKNVILFFLPIQDRGKITSAHEAVPTVLPQDGVPASGVPFRNEGRDGRGIATPVGVSLYDKGGATVERAANNIVVPARVLILPPDSSRNGAKRQIGKAYSSVSPDRVRVFPLKNPETDIKKAAKERRVVKKRRRRRVAAPKEKTPPPLPEMMLFESDMAKMALKRLENCNPTAYGAFGTLNMFMGRELYPDEIPTPCELKKMAADYLRKCYPWRPEYYAPDPVLVPADSLNLSSAVELLGNRQNGADCPLDLTKINFSKADLFRSDLTNADFRGSYFVGASFTDMNLTEADFSGVDLSDALFQRSDVSRASFAGAKLKFSHFHDVTARGSDFSNADMQGAQLRGVNLTLADMGGAIAQDTGWFDVKAYRLRANRTDFHDSEMDKVILDGAKANRADFSGAECKNCLFERADLKRAWFGGAKLENVLFDNADVSDAVFKDAQFKNSASFKDAYLYKADFSGVDMAAFAGFPMEQLVKSKVDRRTVLPPELAKADAVGFDPDADKNAGSATEVSRLSCSQKTCEDRLLGRPSVQNLAVRAQTILSAPEETAENRAWALCTMACVARRDKRLENAQVDILSAFVRENAPWDSERDLFKPYTPVKPEIQMALFLLTDPAAHRDLGHDVDLTGTDLRTADLTNGDLRAIDFSGSHLGGADLRGSKTEAAPDRFDQVVIDEFTRLPSDMGDFKRFMLPDSIVPPWWKPETVRVFRSGSHPWTVAVEDVPFSDDMILTSKKGRKK